jgi:hypothetical protein
MDTSELKRRAGIIEAQQATHGEPASYRKGYNDAKAGKDKNKNMDKKNDEAGSQYKRGYDDYMSESITELKRRAGIAEWDHPEVNTSDTYKAAMTFINGNIDDAFKSTGGDIAKFAELLLMLQREGGNDEMMRLINIASKDRYQAFTR